MTAEVKIGDRIRQCRKAQKLYVKTLAEKIGVSSNYINMIEHHKRNPSRDTLEAIARALKVSVDWLATGEGSKNVTVHSNPLLQENPLFVQMGKRAYDGREWNTEIGNGANSLSDMRFILMMLKWQKPDMFPQKICAIMDITEHELYMALEGKRIHCPKWYTAHDMLLLHIDESKLQSAVKDMCKNIMNVKNRNLPPEIRKHYELLVRYMEQKRLECTINRENHPVPVFQLEEGNVLKNDMIALNGRYSCTYRFLYFDIKEAEDSEEKTQQSNIYKSEIENYIADWVADDNNVVLCFTDVDLFESAYSIAHDRYEEKLHYPYATSSIEEEGLQLLYLSDEKFAEAYPFTDNIFKYKPWSKGILTSD